MQKHEKGISGDTNSSAYLQSGVDPQGTVEGFGAAPAPVWEKGTQVRSVYEDPLNCTLFFLTVVPPLSQVRVRPWPFSLAWLSRGRLSLYQDVVPSNPSLFPRCIS